MIGGEMRGTQLGAFPRLIEQTTPNPTDAGCVCALHILKQDESVRIQVHEYCRRLECHHQPAVLRYVTWG